MKQHVGKLLRVRGFLKTAKCINEYNKNGPFPIEADQVLNALEPVVKSSVTKEEYESIQRADTARDQSTRGMCRKQQLASKNPLCNIQNHIKVARELMSLITGNHLNQNKS